MKTPQDVVRENFEAERLAIETHNAIARVLKTRFNGKRVNRRIVKILENEFREMYGGNPVVYFEEVAGLNNILLWSIPGAKDHSVRRSHFIGHDEDLLNYNPEIFEDRDMCNGSAAIERNKRREAITEENYRELSEAVSALQNAKETLERLGSYGQPFENDLWKIRRDASLYSERSGGY